jgi:ADP-ribose pyrophosphatase YjhB (NUDIX family)
MKSYNFCPHCSNGLIPFNDNGNQFPGCPDCDFIHYNNPVPVVAAIVPVDNKIVLVQRKYNPDKGGWCLPCGFVNAYEDPKEAAIREVEEETGLVIVINKILDTTAPMPRRPGRGNQVVLFYEGKVVGGSLKAGDDALDAKLFSRGEMPPICFGSHEYIVDNWYKER